MGFRGGRDSGRNQRYERVAAAVRNLRAPRRVEGKGDDRISDVPPATARIAPEGRGERQR
jgi:hypothetical protein